MKKFEVFLLPKAKAELEEAALWYEAQQKELGIKLINSFEKELSILQTNALLYSVKYKNYREALIRIFPFVIVYKIESNKVYVVSFFNTKRNPKEKYR